MTSATLASRDADMFPDLPAPSQQAPRDATATPPPTASVMRQPRTPGIAINEDFGAKLHEAQERLLELRQQQETLERQRSELEELRGKQDRFLNGRVDVVERLTKGLTRLDRDTFQSRKRIEMLEHAKENFGRHLDTIESLNPEHWSRADLRNELVRATAALEDAEQDYAEAMARLGMTSHGATATDGGEPAPARGFELPGFRYWLLAGTAFTLPVLVLLALWLLLRLSNAP